MIKFTLRLTEDEKKLLDIKYYNITLLLQQYTPVFIKNKEFFLCRKKH